MTFFRSIATLLAVCLCVAFAYFVGHALAIHSTTPMLYGAGLLLAGAALIVLMARRDRERHATARDWRE
jgi:uncharacterized membrane protein YadS